MRTPLFQVDAFTSRLFTGNPAAVCPLAHWLPEPLLQEIAAENNVSETAFVVPRGRDFEIRWFTPKVEVELCGHATLASAHVLFRHLEPGRTEVVFHSKSGELPVRLEAGRVCLSFPRLPATPAPLPQAVVEGLGSAPRELLAAERDYLAVFDSEEEVLRLAPRFAVLEGLDKSGLIVTAPGKDPRVDFVSRFFAPKEGLPEDPVTGSAHCTLTPYWAARLGKSALLARQISARGGEISCTEQNNRVLLAGDAVTYLVGELNLPEA